MTRFATTMTFTVYTGHDPSGDDFYCLRNWAKGACRHLYDTDIEIDDVAHTPPTPHGRVSDNATSP